MHVLPPNVQTCQQPDFLQNRFDVGGKTRNIAIQLVLQRCCQTSCMFFVARFTVPLVGTSTEQRETKNNCSKHE